MEKFENGFIPTIFKPFDWDPIFFFIGLIVQKISLIICNIKTILLIILQVIEQKFCKLQNGSPRTATAYEAASG